MKKLLRIVFNRWVLAALGLLAVALLIWFAGPLIAFADYRPLESETVRWIVIAVIVAAYLARIAWRAIRARQSNSQLIEGLLKQPAAAPRAEEGPAAQEVAALRQRFEDAMGVLRQARLGVPAGKPMRRWLAALSPRQYVYQLPWYIFIGPPGSGKTTALLNAGLNFPLADRLGEQAVRGVGGTRNCDWWFTDDAVLIDTAGRYTTQESHKDVDAAAWTGFLQLLKKNRPRRPINGAMVTVSVSDLLTQSAAQREAQANAIRRRILELHQTLGIRFPIYLLVTKADLLAGFMEFFGGLGKEERMQVWGFSFPVAEDPAAPAPLARVGEELTALVKRLNDRLIDRMQQERDPQRRALIYSLPQQFAALREPLEDLLQKVFASTRFEQVALLRGVYLTSGTQEGSPLDRVLGALGRSLGLERKLLPPQRPSGKGFFLSRLLKDVVFAEANLAGTNRRWERRRAFLHAAVLGIAGLLTAGALIAWSISYARNKAYVAEVGERMKPVAKAVASINAMQSADVVSLLPVLRSVRQLAQASAVQGESVPVSMGFGLFQGDKLGSAADNAYRRLLQDAFLPRLALRMENLLRREARESTELLYESLKAYLMLHTPERFDPTALTAFITFDWQANLPRETTVEQRQELESHLEALLASGPLVSPLRPDQQLIASTRESIARTPIAQRIYSRLKLQGVGANFPEFTIAKAAGPSATLAFARASGQPLTRGVPGLFTYDGYYKGFVKESERVTAQLAAEEGWVLGMQEKDRGRLAAVQGWARVLEDVRRLYLEDYARTWETFIGDIRVVRAGDMQGSIQLARLLSATDSPLPLLMRAIVKEVTLVPSEQADKGVVEKGLDALKGKREDLERLLGRPGQQPATAAAMSRPEAIVDNRFEALRRVVRSPGPNAPAPIDQVGPLMNELYTHLVAVDDAQKKKLTPPPSDVPTKIKAEAARLPDPVRSTMTDLAAFAQRGVQGQTRALLNEKLLGQVLEFCNKAIPGRYPFAKTSDLDVTQEDFGRLFSPGGLIDDFVTRELAPHVDMSAKPWTFRRAGDLAGGDTTVSLVQFQRAQVIRDVFFRGGGKAAGLKLEFKPIEMDAAITQFLLDVDGQIIRYAHGPQVPASVQWPGPKGTSQVRLQILPSAAGGSSGVVTEGPWALFRMLDRMQMEPTPQPEKYRVTFNVEGRKATFEVLTTSVLNPFRLRELEQFQCPTRL
jgi:type VI secretion system protein ImpL